MKAQCAFVALIFFLLILSPVIARADEGGNKLWDTLKPDYVSTRFFLGKQINYDHWEKEDWEYEIYGFNFGFGYYLDKEKKWKISIDGIYRYYLAYNDVEKVDAETYGLGLSLERNFKITESVGFLIGINGDLSYLPNRDNQPHWKDSGVIGTFGMYLGLEIEIYENINLKMTISPIHSSDPLNDDEFGRNHNRAVVGVVVYF